MVINFKLIMHAVIVSNVQGKPIQIIHIFINSTYRILQIITQNFLKLIKAERFFERALAGT